MAELVRIDVNLPTKERWDDACRRLGALGAKLMDLPHALRFKIEIGLPLPAELANGATRPR